jgi:hypothetical protein
MGSKAIAIVAALTVAGLALLIGAVGTAAADVPVGPGPTNYTEQPQPPPGTCHWRTAGNGEILPDPTCTPGAMSPKVTQDTLATTICRAGYTKSIRPPASITEIEKRENAAAYGCTGSLKEVLIVGVGDGRKRQTDADRYCGRDEPAHSITPT